MCGTEQAIRTGGATPGSPMSKAEPARAHRPGGVRPVARWWWRLMLVPALVTGWLSGRVAVLRLRAEAGTSTAEYAIVTLAAVAFAGVLLAIMRGGEVREWLLSIVREALAR